MTPKDVDEMVVQIGFTISEGLNLLFAGDRNEKNEGLSS